MTQPQTAGIRPLLAHVYEPHRVSFPCYVQPKLNGVRALYQAGHFQSRDLQPFPVGLLDHLAQPLLQLFKSDIVLDGELYVHGWPLQRILGAVTPVRQEANEDTKLVEYHVFDRVDYGQGFEKRFVEDIYIKGPICTNVFAVETQRVKDEADANYFYSAFVSLGYEGMMYRINDCPYTIPKQRKPPSQKGFLSDKNNRVWHLLKRKNWQDEEFICLGLQEGEGKYRGMVGALVCDKGPCDLYITPVGQRIEAGRFSVSSGLSDQQRIDIWANPSLAVSHQIKVKFLTYSIDGIPQNPTIEAIL